MKKIPPDKQTEELRRAKLEFLKRNKQEFDKLKKAFADVELWYEQQRAEQAAFYEANPELKGSEIAPYEEVLAESMQRPAAANASIQFFASWIKLLHSMDEPPLLMPAQEKTTPYREQILADARGTLETILAPFEDPSECLLVAIDLTRPKKVILAETGKVIDDALRTYKKDAGNEWVETETGWIKEPLPQSRKKWLGLTEEILEVWDLYTRAGKQSAWTTFSMVANQVGRPVNTVKDQWRLAYEKIYGEPYTPEVQFSSEAKRREADSLCASCTDAKCYRQAGGEDGISWFSCKEYLELAGTERKLKTVGGADWLRYENEDDD